MILKDGIRSHPKLIKVAPEACWLWVAAIDYSRTQLLDGFVPAEALSMLGRFKFPQKVAQSLVAAGLFEAIDGGYRIHDYLDYNDTAEIVKERRKRDKERKAARVPAEESVGIPLGILLDSVRIPDGEKDARARSRERVGVGVTTGVGSGGSVLEEQEPSSRPNVTPVVLGRRTSLVPGRHPNAAYQCEAFMVPRFLHDRFAGKLANANDTDPETTLQAWYRTLRDRMDGHETPADEVKWLTREFDAWRIPRSDVGIPGKTDGNKAILDAFAAAGQVGA